MDDILDSLNSLIIKTSGGVVAFWATLGYFSLKFLRYCGAKISEGSINDFIKKLFPKIEKMVTELFSSFENKMDIRFLGIENRLNMHEQEKRHKHTVKSQYESLLDAVQRDDKEIIDIHLESSNKK